ncbi:erythromycin esterase family protein [Flavobacteriaceae bacterium M23B6Z8]
MSLKKHCLPLVFFFFFSLLGYSQFFLNLDFEETIADSRNPRKWNLYNKGYDVEVDSLVSFNKNASLRIIDSDSIKKSPFIAVLKIPPALVKTDSLSIKANIKIEENATGFAGIWIRGINTRSENLFYKNSISQPVARDNKWHEVSLSIQIPADTDDITFGIIAKGFGTYWIDNLEITVNNKSFIDKNLSVRIPHKSEIAWLNKVIRPIRSLNEDGTLNDFSFLENFVNNKKIVALGEASHGTSEIFILKHQIIRYLVEEMNFDQFLMEAPLLEAEKMKECFKSEKCDSLDLANTLIYWTWNTKEMKDLMQWIKEFNKNESTNINFAGFDVQGYRLAGSLLSEYTKGKELDSLKSILQWIDRSTSSKDQLNNYNLFKIVAKDIQNQIITSKLSNEIKDKLQLSLKLIDQYLEFKTARSSRDRNMAENVKYHVDREKPNGTILWAHNGHIKQTGESMGRFLAEEYGEDYVNIGFAYHDGFYNTRKNSKIHAVKSQASFPGTYEYFFKQANSPVFFINLRDLRKNDKNKWLFEFLEFRVAGASYQADEFFNTDLVKDFDGIIFINTSTPSHLLQQEAD